MSSGFGAFLAFLWGGYIVEHYGWREAFILAGLPGLAVALLLLLTLKSRGKGPPTCSLPARQSRASFRR